MIDQLEAAYGFRAGDPCDKLTSATRGSGAPAAVERSALIFASGAEVATPYSTASRR